MTRLRRAGTYGFAVAMLSIAVVNVYAFGDRVSGDALIHLTIMERMAAGHGLEFNAGIPEAASSSPLWSFLGAWLWRLGGVAAAVYGLKTVCFVAWASLGVEVWALARRFGAERELGAAAAALALALPGTTMNALQGMENGLFASETLGALLLLESHLRSGERASIRLWGAFALLGLAVATRLEGCVLVLAIAAGHLGTAPDKKRAAVSLVVGLAIAALIGGPIVWLYARSSGHVIPTSGISRVMAARRESSSLRLFGPVWIYGRALIRLAAYAPLSALAAYGLWRTPTRRLAAIVASALVSALLVHTFVIGAAQTSRYLIWFFCLLAAAAASGATSSPRSAFWARAGTVVAAAWIASVAVVESVARREWLNAQQEAGDIVAAPANRKAATDSVLRSLCRGGCCRPQPPAPPAIAAFEVQLRFFLDDRVRVVSLDGATLGSGMRPISFRADGCPNLDAALRDAAVLAFIAPAGKIPVKCATNTVERRLIGERDHTDARDTAWSFDASIGGFVRQCGER